MTTYTLKKNYTFVRSKSLYTGAILYALRKETRHGEDEACFQLGSSEEVKGYSLMLCEHVHRKSPQHGH